MPPSSSHTSLNLILSAIVRQKYSTGSNFSDCLLAVGVVLTTSPSEELIASSLGINTSSREVAFTPLSLGVLSLFYTGTCELVGVELE